MNVLWAERKRPNCVTRVRGTFFTQIQISNIPPKFKCQISRPNSIFKSPAQIQISNLPPKFKFQMRISRNLMEVSRSFEKTEITLSANISHNLPTASRAISEPLVGGLMVHRVPGSVPGQSFQGSRFSPGTAPGRRRRPPWPPRPAAAGRRPPWPPRPAAAGRRPPWPPAMDATPS